MFFFTFFHLELSVLRLFAGTLLQESQKIDLETQQKILWRKLFFKIVSFCNFCRHRISFGLSPKLLDKVAETVFRVFSGALSAKRHFSRKFLLFACFRTLSEKKWGPLAKKLRKSFKWETYVFRWLFEKDNACC